MPENASQLLIRPSFLGRLFGAEDVTFQLSETGLHVTHKDGEFTVLFKQLRTHISAERGTIFYRLYLSAEDDYLFRWLSSRTVLQAVAFIDYAFYKDCADSVSRLSDKTQAHIREQYPTKAFWQRTRRACKTRQKHYQTLPPAKLLTTAQHAAFEYVEGIANGQYTLATAQASYTQKQLRDYKDFFDQVESNPLSEQQRLACVINEQNNLVLAGAGSGKTSVMIGRVGYLLTSQQATPDSILMLAFGNKAAEEMSERVLAKLGTDKIKATTFHSLGQDIIAAVEGKKPALSPLANDSQAMDAYLAQSFEELIQQTEYKASVVRYVLYDRFEPLNPFAFNTLADYNRAVKDNDLRTHKRELVKSYQALLIANFLYHNGIAYQYDAKYPIKTKTPDFRQYQPDFYLPDYGVYIEHFVLDADGNTPTFVDQDAYHNTVDWTRALHAKKQTRCIETFHFEWTEGRLLSQLENKLRDAGVALNPLSDDQVMHELSQAEDRPIEALCELLGKMLKLFKASNMNGELFSIEEQTQAPSTFLQQIFERILQMFFKKRPSKRKISRMKSAQQLMMPLYIRYENHLLDRDEIDFDDMINRAMTYVSSGEFQSPWTHILVDEFQDISSSRADLILALRKQHKDASLFCVGDDWQSIYRFAGSDLRYVTAFKKHFGATQTTTLDKTFRFNNSISDIACQFVSRNPEQINKAISTHTQVTAPAVSLFRCDNSTDASRLANLTTVLQAISALQETSTVLILGRYAFNLPDHNDLIALEQALGNVQISAMTVHASKGKEADFVVVLGLEGGTIGFPSEKQEHPLLDALLPAQQAYQFAEERRLFYVAITRAKHRAYLISDTQSPSRFVQELLEGDYEIERNEFASEEAKSAKPAMRCVVCEVGNMVPRQGQHGDFYGCSCYPRCKHLENGCPACGSVMQRIEKLKVCTSPTCEQTTPLCPECRAELVYRKGKHGHFWGCKNYRSTGASCGYSTTQL
ncbi:hypothetical protein EOL70_03615 [Leucothrix sargassi]|nr:hypothetical protein EOL70_03615 [Leucothrix sargassi]